MIVFVTVMVEKKGHTLWSDHVGDCATHHESLGKVILTVWFWPHILVWLCCVCDKT